MHKFRERFFTSLLLSFRSRFVLLFIERGAPAIPSPLSGRRVPLLQRFHGFSPFYSGAGWGSCPAVMRLPEVFQFRERIPQARVNAEWSNTEERMVIRTEIYNFNNPPPSDMVFINEDGEEIWLGAEVTGDQDYKTIAGTVVVIESYEDGNSFGVRSDNPTFDGHNLDGSLRDDEAHLGWWVTNPHPLYSNSDEPVIEDGAFEDFLS